MPPGLGTTDLDSGSFQTMECLRDHGSFTEYYQLSSSNQNPFAVMQETGKTEREGEDNENGL